MAGFLFFCVFSQRTTGIINVSRGHNWRSLKCRCGFSVLLRQLSLPLLLLLSPSSSGPRLSERGGLPPGHEVQHEQCDSNSITLISVIINGAAGNTGICSPQTANASQSMRSGHRECVSGS